VLFFSLKIGKGLMFFSVAGVIIITVIAVIIIDRAVPGRVC